MKSRQGGGPGSQGAVRLRGGRGGNIQWSHPLILYSALRLHIQGVPGGTCNTSGEFSLC